MDSPHYPFTQKALLAGSLIATLLLGWAFIFRPSSGQGQAEAIGAPDNTVEFAIQTVAGAISPEVDHTPTATPTITPTPLPVMYTVEEGDMLGFIAEAFGISAEAIIAANNISDPTLLQIGQRLLIPVTPTPTPRFSPTPTLSPTPTPEPVMYIVQPGDTLLAIAAEYGTTVEAIIISNGIANPTLLQIGQEIIIPPNRGSILGVPTIIHEVLGGETLSSIAARFGSTVEDILVTNPDLEPRLLQVGQLLIVPLTQPRTASGVPLNPTTPRITSPDPLPPGLAGLAQQMINGVNAHRQNYGLPPYTIDPQLTTSALAHAQDMVTRGYFSHVTLEGAHLNDRLTAQGVNFGWTGENIQRNVQPYDQSAGYALNWFMNSRVHRANILHGNFTRFGVGVAEGPPGWYTYVLVFGGN